jgi:L-alanine-DL-glutamate epimerase-like enolase superfamily enzyme
MLATGALCYITLMQIVQLRTLRPLAHSNLLFVELATDEGLVGLGEAWFGTSATEAYLHAVAAPLLLGRDPLRIREHAALLHGYVGNRGSGAETRGRSAIDIACWDLLGKASGQPLHALFGGRCRDSAAIYNTCAGTRYVQSGTEQASSNWGLEAASRYEDLAASIEDPVGLARDLLDQGVTAMKVWPFDRFAEASNGHHISSAELEQGLEPLRRIREAVGARMDLMVELHGLWHVPSARRILLALNEIQPRWVEDPIDMDDAHGVARLARDTTVPIAGGETLTGTNGFRRLLELEALDVAIFDAGWCGGITDALAIGALAAAHGTPVAPHDCTGPVGLAVGTHLSVALPHAVAQETTRAFYHGWYADLVDTLPPIADGRIAPPPGAGHGLALHPEALERGVFETRVSGIEGAAAPLEAVS